MRNIFLFIRRYFNFLLFLLLQAFSIYLITHYNKYHHAVGSAMMNEVTGKINNQYSEINEFFLLKKKNKDLHLENERLRNQLRLNFETPDTTNRLVIDSIPFDTLGNHRKWLYQNARVVSNSVSAQNNFIVLARGAAQELMKDEGVVDTNNGVVGIVTDISENFAVVMSLLHKDSRISGILKNDPNGGGSITWDGKEPNYLSFSNVRQSAKAKKGDTVITSGITPTFPYGMMIGTIDEIRADKSTNNFIIKIKTTANFYNLQYVYAIKNFQREEIDRLVEKAKSRNL
ncbi:MAG: rod shape-determining protein MreC [Chitinophagaceae bacterium]|nr:rod shape-determining protein MreC [Chitinophagaceae bacterium]